MLLVFVEFCATRFCTIAEQYHEDHHCVRDRYTSIYIMDDAIARDLEKIQFETQIQAFLIEVFCFINKHNFLMFIDV